MSVEYRFHSLEDFLTSTMHSIDGQLDDGWNASFPVKGCEIDATVLFADISFFAARTLDLTPAETLIFVNKFFAWISAEALRGTKAIVDKYIGDEVMIVFSTKFVQATRSRRRFRQPDGWQITMRSRTARTWASPRAT